ncbi:hypothetical protein [Paenibacillus sp. sgz5001063]|uniref:hypothetical protein n=1 Tax=Paenibacillus sp. sgz5001063 TaxID=3242474 RepID=UPI0036D38DC2
MRDKAGDEKCEEMLREYYSREIPAPAWLVPVTLRRMRWKEVPGTRFAALAVLIALALLLLWGCLLMGPIPLLWKLTLLLSLGVVPAVASVVLLLYMSGRDAEIAQT